MKESHENALIRQNKLFVNLAGTTHIGVCTQAEESIATCVYPFLLRMRKTSQIALPQCLRITPQNDEFNMT
jgi:hypothetical protein